MAKKVEEKNQKAIITRVHPSGRIVFVKIEGTDRERHVPVTKLIPKKDKYEIGDEVTLDFPDVRNIIDARFAERQKEMEERRKAMREEADLRREEHRKGIEERRKKL